MASPNPIRQANDSFYKAMNEMLKGSLLPMQEVWSHAKDVTLEGPFGGILLGYEDVIEEFRREADMHFSGSVGPVDVLIRAGAELAYVTCMEVGQDIVLDGKAISLSHRATNIFRKEDNEWKMVHHHADMSSSLLTASESAFAV